MKLYSIEDNKQKRSYYIAEDTKDFIDIVATEISQEKNIHKTKAKKELKYYNLSKYNKDVKIPILDEESLYHIKIKVEDLANQYPNYKGYIGYALMSQYFFEL